MTSRRDRVPFDPRHFEKQAEKRGETTTLASVFGGIYAARHWAAESPSGEGAAPAQTARLEAELPALLHHIGATHLLDAPCGDFGWMQRVNLAGIDYTGADIVPELVAENQARYGSAHRRFVPLDLTRDALPPADVLLCRDLSVHLSFADIWRALRNARRSGIPWLLTTTFPGEGRNEDITSGDWRPLNFERAPFAFPPPTALLVEGCTEGGGAFADKSLGLWPLARLRV